MPLFGLLHIIYRHLPPYKTHEKVIKINWFILFSVVVPPSPAPSLCAALPRVLFLVPNGILIETLQALKAVRRAELQNRRRLPHAAPPSPCSSVTSSGGRVDGCAGRRKGDRYVANLTERFDLVALLVLPFGFRLFPTVLMNKLRSATITQEGE